MMTDIIGVIILLGIPMIITIIYIYLQKLVMKLPHKIWHFVPLLFFVILTVYGYLRSSRIIVYYARYMKKKMTTSEFEKWSRFAAELRDKAERGEIGLEEYVRDGKK